jgi:hypothetical protein
MSLKKREIIQISNGKKGHHNAIALCNDGTVWICKYNMDRRNPGRAWEQLPPIPQEVKPNDA